MSPQQLAGDIAVADGGGPVANRLDFFGQPTGFRKLTLVNAQASGGAADTDTKVVYGVDSGGGGGAPHLCGEVFEQVGQKLHPLFRIYRRFGALHCCPAR